MKKLILLIVLFLWSPVFADNADVPQLANQNVFVWGIVSIISSFILIFLYIKLYKINIWVNKGPEENWEKRAKILTRWSNIKSYFVPIYFFIILGTFILFRNSIASVFLYYLSVYSLTVFSIFFILLIFYCGGSKFKSYEKKTNLILVTSLPILILIITILIIILL